MVKQLWFLPKSKQKETAQIYNFRNYKFTAKEFKQTNKQLFTFHWLLC